MPEILITAPSVEPIDLAAAKLHLRLTEDSQNSIVTSLLAGARQAAETITRRQLVHARWQLTLDRFPMAGVGTPLPFENDVNIPGYAIRLPHSPCVRVESVKYMDMSGSLQTVDPSVYTVNTSLMPAIITPRFGQIWPIALPQIGAVTVTYTAGHASPIEVTNGTGNLKVRGPVTWAVNDVVRFYNSGGALPSPLLAGRDYTVASVSGNTYTLTDEDGAAVVFSDTGTGTSYIGVVPDGIRNWMLMRLGSLYENREEVAILNRGMVGELPFVEGLLDPYKTALP